MRRVLEPRTIAAHNEERPLAAGERAGKRVKQALAKIVADLRPPHAEGRRESHLSRGSDLQRIAVGVDLDAGSRGKRRLHHSVDGGLELGAGLEGGGGKLF